MAGRKVAEVDKIRFQLKSIFIFYFLDEYNHFEKIVRKVFENNLSNVQPEMYKKLYFFYGGRLGTYINYEENIIKLQEVRYHKDETFRNFSVNQIIKLFKSSPTAIKKFDFSIGSLQKRTSYPFFDSALQLLSMRNKLAHEVNKLTFSNKDIIELLPLKTIEEKFNDTENEFGEIIKEFDISKMDEQTQAIASNIIYMQVLITKLESES